MIRKLSEKPFEEKPDDNIIICRCEEITKGEIRRAVYDGMSTMDEVKRYLRTGMGPCQGMTCTSNVKSIIARELGVSPAEIEEPTPRSPQRPVMLKEFGNETKEDEGL